MGMRVWFAAWLVFALCGAPVYAAGISGKIKVKGDLKDQSVWLHWHGLSKDGQPDQAGIPEGHYDAPGSKTHIEVHALGGERTYSVTKLHPGFHLLCASVEPQSHELREWHFPMAWKWVELKDENDNPTVDLEVGASLDEKQLGTVEVEAPKGKKLHDVGFLPIDGLDLSSKEATAMSDPNVAMNLFPPGFSVNGDKAKLSVKGVLPGKYRVVDMFDGSTDVEVKAGETVEAKLARGGGK